MGETQWRRPGIHVLLGAVGWNSTACSEKTATASPALLATQPPLLPLPVTFPAAQSPSQPDCCQHPGFTGQRKPLVRPDPVWTLIPDCTFTIEVLQCLISSRAASSWAWAAGREQGDEEKQRQMCASCSKLLGPGLGARQTPLRADATPKLPSLCLTGAKLFWPTACKVYWPLIWYLGYLPWTWDIWFQFSP